MSDLHRLVLDAAKENPSLAKLLCIIRKNLAASVDEIKWNSLLIDYTPPTVERLWTQIGPMRLLVHRIHKAGDDGEKDALFHPHPWPSAIFILSGKYEMGIGHSVSTWVPNLDAKIKLTPGCFYEMLNQNGWHYVNPSSSDSLSLMLTGTPWKYPHPFYLKHEKNRRKLDPLSEDLQKVLITDLKQALVAPR